MMIEPIYVYRPVTDMGAAALVDYAYNIGIENPVLDMHVTLAHSEDAVDWDRPEFQMDPRPLTITGGERSLQVFGENAVVLEVESRALSQRWAQFIMAGATWDFPDFRPHITLGYQDGFQVVDKIPLRGEIPFGPEIREWLNPDPVVLTA